MKSKNNPFLLKNNNVSIFKKIVKPLSKKQIRNIPKKRLNYMQARVAYPRMNPFGDKDKDRVPNFLDCKPFDVNRQDRATRKYIQRKILKIGKKQMRTLPKENRIIVSKLTRIFEKNRDLIPQARKHKWIIEKELISQNSTGSFQGLPSDYPQHIGLKILKNRININTDPQMNNMKKDITRTTLHELLGHGTEKMEHTTKDMPRIAKYITEDDLNKAGAYVKGNRLVELGIVVPRKKNY
jgi:hypothetical protein